MTTMTANSPTRILLALITALAILSVFPALASAAECSNERVRTESNTNPATGQAYDLGLPECRAYEMVSPLEKGGSDIQTNESQGTTIPASPDGEAVGFMSQNAFANAENYLNAGVGTAVNAYVARRGGSGWASVYALAPRTLIGHPDALRGPDGGLRLETVANCGLTVINNATAGTDAVCARESDGSWTGTSDYQSSTGGIYGGDLSGGSDVRYLGGSADLSHVIFESTGGRGENAQFLPADTSLAGGGDGLYEVAGLGSASSILRLVNVDDSGNEIGPSTASKLGGISSENGMPLPCRTSGASFGVSYQAISESGETVYFTACPSNIEGSVNTVYARRAGTSTVAVSSPSPSQCTTCSSTAQSAAYQGASADGSKVFFTTTQQLVNEDTDSTMDLYEYDFDNPPGQNIVQVSRGAAGDLTQGAGANVQGVVRTSSDGSHVYFVATGVLTTVPNNAGQVASMGADNLYGWDRNESDPEGQVKFIAKLCSNANASGSVGVAECPASLNGTTGVSGVNDRALWEGAPEEIHRPAQTTPDGRYLVFTSYAQLITNGPEADTDEAQDVYRYDFQTGELVRVSIGEPGFSASHNGNTPGMNARIAAVPAEGVVAAGAMASINDWARAISDDGSTIIFATPERLQANDMDTGPNPSCVLVINANATGCDLYAWHYKKKSDSENQGEVSMVSPGTDAISGDTHDGAGVMSASGSDIFFFTRSRLVGQDTDGLVDLYDARVGGGFPAPAAEPSCTEEGWTCQGTPSRAPAGLEPEGSATQLAGGNLTPLPFIEPAEKSTVKPKALTNAQKLAAELKACKKDKRKTKRAVCERRARKKHGSAKSRHKAKPQ